MLMGPTLGLLKNFISFPHRDVFVFVRPSFIVQYKDMLGNKWGFKFSSLDIERPPEYIQWYFGL